MNLRVSEQNKFIYQILVNFQNYLILVKKLSDRSLQ
jgi:hypothetical protein